MIIWKSRIGDQLFRITHHCQQRRHVLASQLAPRCNQKVHDFHLVPAGCFPADVGSVVCLASLLGCQPCLAGGCPGSGLSCVHNTGENCRTMQMNVAGGAHIQDKSPNLAKMMKKKSLFCVIPLSESLHCRPEFSYSSVAQMHRCFTFKTKLLPGCKLLELVVSTGVGV